MRLELDDAIAVFARLPTGVRARLSGKSLTDAEGVARYVRAACEVGGLFVDEAGMVGKGGDVPPAESERRFLVAARSNPDAVKAADDAIKRTLDREQRSEALMRALYSGGLALDVDVTR